MPSTMDIPLSIWPKKISADFIRVLNAGGKEEGVVLGFSKANKPAADILAVDISGARFSIESASRNLIKIESVFYGGNV